VVVAGIVIASVLPVVFVLLLAAAAIVVAIWLGVPLCVRVGFSFMLMIVDDVPLRQSWNSVAVSTGQAWGFIGLLFVAGIGFSVVSQVTTVFFNLGTTGVVIGIVLWAAVYMIQTLFTTVYAVIVARGLSDAPLPPAAAAVS
jgi:hypothetical protein